MLAYRLPILNLGPKVGQLSGPGQTHPTATFVKSSFHRAEGRLTLRLHKRDIHSNTFPLHR